MHKKPVGMKTVVVGASGYLGRWVCEILRRSNMGEIYGTCRRNKGPGLLQLDLLNAAGTEKIFSLLPDTVIWCVRDRENEDQISREGLRACIGGLSPNTRFLYISTMVGNGEKQKEDTPPQRRKPGDYAWQYFNGKIEGETFVRAHENHVIIRPGSLYGFGCDGKPDRRMQALLNRLKQERLFPATVNKYTSYVHVTDLAKAIVEVIRLDFRGTVNISGETPVSYYEFYRCLARLCGLDESRVQPETAPESSYRTFDNTFRRQILKTQIREI